MEHNTIRHKLSEYLDAAVTAAEKAGIEEHLKACSQCSNALSELRKTIEAVRQVEEAEPPAWMASKIMAGVRAEAERKKSVFQRLFYPLAVKVPLQTVAVLFLAVTAFYIYRSIRPEMRYAEAPTQMFEAKKGAPAPGKATGTVRRAEEPSPRQPATQAPGYRSLDMKYAYERPAPPVPKDEAAAPAPAEQPLSRDEAGMSSDTAVGAPENAGGKGAEKAKEAPAMVMMQEKAGRSTAPAKEGAKPAAACLSYGPAVVSVRGMVREKGASGPPSWILTLDKAVCVTETSGSAQDRPEGTISEMQLVLDPAGYAKHRGLLMKPVMVRGTLSRARTDRHHTRVLLTVLDIAERR